MPKASGELVGVAVGDNMFVMAGLDDEEFAPQNGSVPDGNWRACEVTS